MSEATYPELTMTNGGAGLLRFYLVKQCKANLNSLCHISRTPGGYEGAQLNFEDELTTSIRNKASEIFLYEYWYYLMVFILSCAVLTNHLWENHVLTHSIIFIYLIFMY